MCVHNMESQSACRDQLLVVFSVINEVACLNLLGMMDDVVCTHFHRSWHLSVRPSCVFTVVSAGFLRVLTDLESFRVVWWNHSR